MNTKKISIFVISVIISFCFIGCIRKTAPSNLASETKLKESITFFITTDIHYLDKSLTDDGKAFQEFIENGDGKQLHYIEEITDAFINDIKKRRPEFLIISGDLTNNGEKESHLNIAKKLKRIEKMGTSIYVIPGNHDIQNPKAIGFSGDKQYKVDTITSEEFEEIYGDFGYNEAISRDKNSLSYLSTPSKNIWLLMLDTNKYENNMSIGFPQIHGCISHETLKWIEECSNLAKEKNAQIIAIMHHSLLNHSQVLKEGFILDNAKETLKVFENCEINLVLTGHIHIQDIKYHENNNKTIYDIATSSLAVYPHHYGVLTYSPSYGYDYNTNAVDVENWSKEVNIKDKNINNFREYSQNFFKNHFSSMFYDILIQTGKFKDRQAKFISKTLASLNLKYFAGTGFKIVDKIEISDELKTLEKPASEFLKNYTTSIFSNKNEKIDNNNLHIPFSIAK